MSWSVKLRKVGNSYVATVPSSVVREHEWEEGEIITLQLAGDPQGPTVPQEHVAVESADALHDMLDMLPRNEQRRFVFALFDQYAESPLLTEWQQQRFE